MATNNHKKKLYSTLNKQHGAALVLLAFIIGLAVTALMIKSFGVASIEAARDEKTMRALGQAKEALISWSISHMQHPGQMPWPDRNGDGNYDGGSDCASNSFSISLFIGQLPIKRATNPCENYPGLGNDFIDSSGNRLWYAVSRNLVHNYDTGTDPIINPGIIDAPNYSWLKVLDRNGNVISDRVAAVIIAPGPVLIGQDQSGVPDVGDYLDNLQIGATAYSNRDYDSDDEDFIIAPGSTSLPDTDNTYQSPYRFNDKLVYITVDELMAALEKRVASEVKAALIAYRAVYGEFPYASPTGSALNYSCKNNLNEGFLPLDTSVSFVSPVSCTSASNCSGVNFSDISSVSYTTSINFNWTGATGNCSRSGKVCTCSGTGSCTIFGVITYSCNQLTGSCSSNFLMSGNAQFTPASTDVLDTSGTANACSSRVTISGAGTFTATTCDDPGISPKFDASKTLGSNVLMGSGFQDQYIEPGMHISGVGIADDTIVISVTSNTSLTMSKNATAGGTSEVRISRLYPWFFANGWQNYVYYAMSRSSGLAVGTRSNVNAILVTAGKEITTGPFAESTSDGLGNLEAQSRILSCSRSDYLDSSQNADGDEIYDASNKSRKQNYNDQIFIVAP